MTNIQLNAATTVGALLASDTVAGVDYQKMKVTFSTDGSVPVSVDATHPMPVTFGAGGLSANISQFGGSNVVTGLGGSGAGIPRVTVSNDTETQIWDGTTGPVAVKPASTAAVAADKALVVAISPNNSVAVTGTITTTPPANASTNIAQVGGAALSEGQKTMAASVPVVIASDQSAVPVSGTVTTTPPANASTNLTQVAGTALGATAVTNFGTAPAAAAVPGVNASLFSGTTALTQTGGAIDVNLKTSAATVAENLTQVASTVLGVPQTFGTAPTGVVLGTSSDIYVAGTRARSNQTTTAAGVIDVNLVGSLGVTNSVTNGSFASITDGTTKAGVIAATTALKTDMSSVAGTATVTGTGASGAGIQRVTVSNDSNVIVTPPTLTKGTQGATGFSTQDLRDAGRNTRIFMLDTYTAAPLVEAVQTVVQWYGNAAVAGTTQPAVVPAGKTLRLTGWRITYLGNATFNSAIVRIRANTAGLGVLASPMVASFEAGSNLGATTVAIVGARTTETGCFPEGIDIPAAAGLAFSMAGSSSAGALQLSGSVRFEVYGYEF